MKRVIIIGCPGSGKSTFSLKLSKLLDIPIYHLDNIYWKADKTTITRDEFDQRLDEILAKDIWIIDGNYLRTMETRIKEADTVYFLDIDTKTCLDSINERIGKKRVDMPWIEDELDQELVDQVKAFDKVERPKIIALLTKYDDKYIHIFRDRDEVNAYLENFS